MFNHVGLLLSVPRAAITGTEIMYKYIQKGKTGGFTPWVVAAPRGQISLWVWSGCVTVYGVVLDVNGRGKWHVEIILWEVCCMLLMP